MQSQHAARRGKKRDDLIQEICKTLLLACYFFASFASSRLHSSIDWFSLSLCFFAYTKIFYCHLFSSKNWFLMPLSLSIILPVSMMQLGVLGSSISRHFEMQSAISRYKNSWIYFREREWTWIECEQQQQTLLSVYQPKKNTTFLEKKPQSEKHKLFFYASDCNSSSSCIQYYVSFF